ncbi:MAG: hypothetical protein RR007_03845 [Kiritimatiellia bacterium]
MNFLKELIEAYKVSHNPLFDPAFYGMMYVLRHLLPRMANGLSRKALAE